MQRHVTEFLGPIFAKEIIEIARRWRYYLCRTFYGAAFVLIMWFVWEQYQLMVTQMGLGNSLARVAATIFTATSHIQFWAVYLLVPAFLCGAVAGEREEHTLELLLVTPLTDREIVLGKLFSRVAAMVCLILCGVPVVSLLMLFGGIGPDSIWRVLAATLLAILFAGSHAIYFSVITKAPMEALSRTYVAFFFWFAGLPILAWAGREVCLFVWGGIPAELSDYLAPFSLAYPLMSFWGGVDDTYHATLAFIWGVWAWPLTFVGPALWSVYLSWRAIRRLRQLPKPRESWTRWLPGTTRRRDTLPPPEIEVARRARAGTPWLIGAIANPLWLRARLTQVYDRAGSIGRLNWIGWSVVVPSLLLIVLFRPDELNRESWSIAFQAPTWATLLLVTALVSGHSLMGDRRRGFLEQVIVTPLCGREITDGTILAVWEHLRRLLWLPFAIALFFCVTGASPAFGTICSVVTAVLFGAVLTCHGVACSLAARSPASAVVATFLLPAIVVFVVPVIAVLFPRDYVGTLWLVLSVWFAATGLWVRWRPDAAAVGCFLTAMHLVLIALAECWTREGPESRFPVAAMHPAFLIVMPLLQSEPGNANDMWKLHWQAMLFCYWAALALNIVLVRAWLARRFDRLAGRYYATASDSGVISDPSRYERGR